jgi:hypothetical protein
VGAGVDRWLYVWVLHSPHTHIPGLISKGKSRRKLDIETKKYERKTQKEGMGASRK